MKKLFLMSLISLSINSNLFANDFVSLEDCHDQSGKQYSVSLLNYMHLQPHIFIQPEGEEEYILNLGEYNTYWSSATIQIEDLVHNLKITCLVRPVVVPF